MSGTRRILDKLKANPCFIHFFHKQVFDDDVRFFQEQLKDYEKCLIQFISTEGVMLVTIRVKGFPHFVSAGILKFYFIYFLLSALKQLLLFEGN